MKFFQTKNENFLFGLLTVRRFEHEQPPVKLWRLNKMLPTNNKMNLPRALCVIMLMIITPTMFSSCYPNQLTLCKSKINKCVSIEDFNGVRYIFFGQNQTKNYVKLDISKLDLESESIFVCWNNENNKLAIINPKTEILEFKLDTSIYQFSNIYELDSLGMPQVFKYHENGNVEFNMRSGSLFPLNTDVEVR